MSEPEQEPLFALPPATEDERERGALARRQMREIDECPRRARMVAENAARMHDDYRCQWCEGWREAAADIIRKALG